MQSLIPIVRNAYILRLAEAWSDGPNTRFMFNQFVFQLRIHQPQRETLHSISNSIIRNDIVEQHARPRIHGKDFPRQIAWMNAYRIITKVTGVR